jgi:hypothetical protein
VETPATPTKEQAARALVDLGNRIRNTQQTLANAQAALAQLQGQLAKAEADFLAAAGPADGKFGYNGWLITVAGGAVTLTPPGPVFVTF